MSKTIILSPNPDNSWESKAVFNPCPIKHDNQYSLLYRALSDKVNYHGVDMELSTIGIADSSDGQNYQNRRSFIFPQHDWERFGCEDPRVTFLDGKFYILYTAVSTHPANPSSIRLALAISTDLKTIDSKYPLIPLNSKAGAFFPQKIDDKYTIILTVDTDTPPAKLAIAQADKIEDFLDQSFWQDWYKHIDKHSLNLARLNTDQVELGAPPILTNEGWLIIYSHIQNYFNTKDSVFGIEAVILDKHNPKKIIKRTKIPLIKPEYGFGDKGMIENVVFPSGALLENNKLSIFFGVADNFCAQMDMDYKDLLSSLDNQPQYQTFKLSKFKTNPIIKPNPNYFWQSGAVFNPAAVYENDTFYIVYRAFSADNTSTLGLAESKDGRTFNTFDKPIYVPRADFEQKKKEGGLSGCEDPRITKIGDTFHMFYTAYDSINPPRVAYSNIKVDDFIKKKWNWSEPVLVSPPGVDDKNTCLFPQQIFNHYVVLHRVNGQDIAVDFIDDLNFEDQEWLQKEASINHRSNSWDSKKIGVAAPPLKTDYAWLLFYHGVSDIDSHYRVGFMFLDLKDPSHVIYRNKYPVLEPTEVWEKQGDVPNVVFPCGAVLVGDDIFVYYGGADKVVCGATCKLSDLIQIAKNRSF